MLKVFVSYSHDDDEHKARVHGLADRLGGEDGIVVILDRDTGPGGPDEGWPSWSERQVLEADRVLIAVSPEYAVRYQGNDDDPDRGFGTVIEAQTIQQYLYDHKGVNPRFRVVLLDPGDVDAIPTQLKKYQRFDATEDGSYAELLDWLKVGVKDADAPPAEGPVWPKANSAFKLPLADRRPHFATMRAAMSGQTSNQIFLFEGDGASGKTDFLNELTNYARRIGVSWTRFDFKGAPAIEEIFETVLLDLGAELLGGASAAATETPFVELVTDLQGLKTPTLFFFDTFEQATAEASSWLETKFLPRVRQWPAVIVVVAGRNVPNRSQYPWRSLAEFHTLGPIENTSDWADYVERVHGVQLDEGRIAMLIDAAEGNPSLVRPLVDNLANRGDE